MKNVTIAIDDETQRRARIRAAEMGTSLSALVKAYLQQLADGPSEQGVRDMPMTYTAQPAVAAPPAPKKLRQPGAMRGQIGMADDFDTPDWLIDAMEGKGSELPWPE